MIVALMGIDGSGKTTQAKLLSSMLSRMGFKVKLVYAGNSGIRLTGRYSFYLSLPIDILVNRMLKINKEEFYKKYKNIAKIEEILLFLNYALFIALKLPLLEKMYDVVLADRYVYDFILSRIILLSSHSRGLLKLLLLMTPKPEVLVVLDLDEETAYARKEERSLYHLKLLRSGYLKLAELLGASVISSNTNIITTSMKLWCLVSSKL
ncbi:MAG: hypothetical protein QXM00_11415 [Candidatus Bathyarchaeia archaeon]